MRLGKIDAQRLRRVDLPLHAVKIDIVVAGSVHLGKRQAHLLRAHVVDVHKLCAVLRIAASEAIRQRVCGVDGGDTRHSALDCLSANLHTVARGQPPLGRGREDIVDLAALDEV
ncbi:hypothetical protein SDC9_130455 [bioreactor metagenome]|uniref:Uncharacterized protein n=1 Tax=bioreactor metagenome TaxID=1076179 RepID=A0A645D2K8_9ZZZZ